MADGVDLASPTGTCATDDVTDGGVANGQQVQRVKAGFGSNNNYADPTGGSGTVDAGTQRVTLATDVALPAGTNTIGKVSGIDAEDAAATANPMLAGGRYDATPRTLDDGDAGAFALDSDGSIQAKIMNSEDAFAFQTSSILTNGSSYDSGILTLSPDYSQVQTHVFASHDGEITITWYSDASGTDLVRTLVIPYTASRGFEMFAAPAFTPYNKYVFLNNSGSNQTDFYFDTKFLRRSLSPQILRVDATVAAGMVAGVQRSLITAYDGNNYTNVNATNGGNLKVSISEASDGLDIGAGNIKTAAELIDDAIYVDSVAWTASTSKHMLTGGVYNASPIAYSDGDTGAFAMDVNGHMITSAHAGSVALADGISNTQNILVDESDAFMAQATLGYMYNGATWDRLRGSTADGLTVNLGTNNDVTVSGTAAVTQSGTWNINNVSGTVSLPTGAATSANQSTANTALSAIQTAVEILDNIVSGNEAQCDVITQPARAATTDNVGAGLMTNALYDGTTALTPKFAVINESTSGNNTLVAAVAGKKIRVVQAILVAAGDVVARFEDGAGGTALTGQHDLTTNSGFTLPFSPVGWFETTANTLLNLELDAGVNVSGCLVYVEV
jgi:hypothetical protein